MFTYRSIATVNAQNRKVAYEALGVFIAHLDPLNVNLSSITYNATTKRIDVVTFNAIPAGQLEHLGIEES
jgi:hypothetical protein